MKNKREQLDFTDKELYYVARAFESFLNDRDTWLGTNGSRRIVNNTLTKIAKNGLTRKNYKKILAPIHKFEDDE